MDYIQLLFSFFNAPLFATFIIGMFWKRMTPAGGLLRASIAGTIAAVAAHYANKWGWIEPRARTRPRRSGARSAAFVADAIVTVAVTLRHQARSRSRSCRASSTAWRTSTSHERASERVWYRRPQLLGCGALADEPPILTIMFI